MKPLRDITQKKTVSSTPVKKELEGQYLSKTVDTSLGNDPGVDYDPKAPDDRDFVAKHKTQKHDDRVGNDEKLYTASNIKYSLDDKRMKTFGHKKDEAKKVYESNECNHTGPGEACPVHGDKACPGEKNGKSLKVLMGDKKPVKESKITKDFIASIVETKKLVKKEDAADTPIKPLTTPAKYQSNNSDAAEPI